MAEKARVCIRTLCGTTPDFLMFGELAIVNRFTTLNELKVIESRGAKVLLKRVITESKKY